MVIIVDYIIVNINIAKKGDFYTASLGYQVGEKVLRSVPTL